MNKAETEAKRHYKLNKIMAESGLLTLDVLCKIARKQDKLYKVINERADRKINEPR